MLNNIAISGFSDEISSDLDTITKVSELGMHYISLRGIDDENIGDYTVEKIKKCYSKIKRMEYLSFFYWLSDW